MRHSLQAVGCDSWQFTTSTFAAFRWLRQLAVHHVLFFFYCLVAAHTGCSRQRLKDFHRSAHNKKENDKHQEQMQHDHVLPLLPPAPCTIYLKISLRDIKWISLRYCRRVPECVTGLNLHFVWLLQLAVRGLSGSTHQGRNHPPMGVFVFDCRIS